MVNYCFDMVFLPPMTKWLRAKLAWWELWPCVPKHFCLSKCTSNQWIWFIPIGTNRSDGNQYYQQNIWKRHQNTSTKFLAASKKVIILFYILKFFGGQCSIFSDVSSIKLADINFYWKHWLMG
jgi:hypothetical protein